MKKFIKLFATVIIVALLITPIVNLNFNADSSEEENQATIAALTVNPTVQAAAKYSADDCGDIEENKNPNVQQINCLLTQIALQYDVPPEIVKAIAFAESKWEQFDENGSPIISDDGGIGIMQITNHPNYDTEKLKNDIIYNITAGVEILDYMFERTDLPTINNKDRHVLEHWYFAIMAYNGIKPVNSPVVQATGEKNSNAYQEKVYQIIKANGNIEVANLPFKSEDFSYNPDDTENIVFVTKEFDFTGPFTKSKHFFKNGDTVGATTNRLRPGPSTAGNYTNIDAGEILTITGPFVFDENPNSNNQFVWYPVRKSDGRTGYVASSYLDYRFVDVPMNHYAEKSIYQLFDQKILNGIGDNQFGLGREITRVEAAILLTRAQGISLENRANPWFDDVPTDHKYYKEIAAAVETGLFQGVDAVHFNPNGKLSRAEMAVLLDRLYDFPDVDGGGHPFVDLEADWYKNEVARIYAAGITQGAGAANTYAPKKTVTREEFAVFMVRAMDWVKEN